MFKPLTKDGNLLGLTCERENHFYFFGSRFVRQADLPVLFPKFRFCFLKQVHGREVIEANPDRMIEADAHFTSAPNLALVAQSADCMPILISSKNQICAIHAGWRGMAQNIIHQTANYLTPPVFIAIGPHIRSQSFEIGLDVAASLLAAAPNRNLSLTKPLSDPQKVLFDLRALAHAQLTASYGANLSVEECLEDTKSNPLFHSFRRDREKAERQYSFVAINS